MLESAGCHVAGPVSPASDAFAFQKLDEARCDGIVMAVSIATHAGLETVLAQKRLPLAAGELGPLIRMHHDPAGWLLTPDGHQQGLQGEVGYHSGLGRPPTTRHEDRSMTTQRYSQPSWDLMYVILVIQI